jgi:GNAT superfamily N-acetyltransferase
MGHPGAEFEGKRARRAQPGAGKLVLTFGDATADDVAGIVRVRVESADELTRRFGQGHWSSHATERGVQNAFRHARMLVGRSRGRILTVLRLATKKPWAIDVSYFSPVPKALYLTDMAVAPEFQRRGLGRAALDHARRVALDWPADALRLDAYDAHGAGAGGFYAACGFAERGRVVYRGTPLIYYELLLRPAPGPTDP